MRTRHQAGTGIGKSRLSNSSVSEFRMNIMPDEGGDGDEEYGDEEYDDARRREELGTNKL
jgi:hypothetical protein